MSSDVKKYSWHVDAGCMVEEADGAYVESEDHEREVQRAIAAGIRMQDKCAALEAENARLSQGSKLLIDDLERRDATIEALRAQLAAIQGGMGDEPLVVATAILGGLYHGGSGPEFGDIDVEVCMPHLEKIQCETVDSSDNVFMPLMTVAQHQRITAAMAAELADAKSARDAYGQNAIDLQKQRDALRAELAITRRVIDRIGQLCTTPHESKERFIRRVQSVIEWERAAQQDQPQ